MLDPAQRRDWLFQRAVQRVASVDGVVAEYATSICGRPARRRVAAATGTDGHLGSVTWSIDDDVVVELDAVARGRHRVAVYDVGLLGPLRRQLRSRHFVVGHASR